MKNPSAIVQYKNDARKDILRQRARPVPLNEITGKEVHSVIDKMFSALHKEEDGVALAANQINSDLAIFVVSKKIFQDEEARKHLGFNLDKFVYINPKIIKRSSKKVQLDEGCLSVRWLYGKTLRHKNVVIEAYDENGKLFQRGAGGLLAQIYQHETDHLNGILFCDHAKNLKEIKPDDDARKS